jgi:hypothetical protein
MLTKTKVALAAVIVCVTAVSASAATRPQVTRADQSASSNVIPGYDRNGGTVGIQNPDQPRAKS